MILFDADADPGFQNDADPYGSEYTTLPVTTVPNVSKYGYLELEK
jgi:hypothetical protein